MTISVPGPIAGAARLAHEHPARDAGFRQATRPAPSGAPTRNGPVCNGPPSNGLASPGIGPIMRHHVASYLTDAGHFALRRADRHHQALLAPDAAARLEHLLANSWLSDAARRDALRQIGKPEFDPFRSRLLSAACALAPHVTLGGCSWRAFGDVLQAIQRLCADGQGRLTSAASTPLAALARNLTVMNLSRMGAARHQLTCVIGLLPAGHRILPSLALLSQDPDLFGALSALLPDEHRGVLRLLQGVIHIPFAMNQPAPALILRVPNPEQRIILIKALFTGLDDLIQLFFSEAAEQHASPAVENGDEDKAPFPIEGWVSSVDCALRSLEDFPDDARATLRTMLAEHLIEMARWGVPTLPDDADRAAASGTICAATRAVIAEPAIMPAKLRQDLLLANLGTIPCRAKPARREAWFWTMHALQTALPVNRQAAAFRQAAQLVGCLMDADQPAAHRQLRLATAALGR